LIGEAVGLGIRHALEGWQNEGAGGAGGGRTEQKADARLIDSGIGWRRLREDHVRIAGSVKVRESAEIEVVAAQRDGSKALRLTGYIGDGDLLRAETLSYADLPAVADARAGGGRLREDAADRNDGGVELVFKIDAEAGMEGCIASFSKRHVREIGDGGFAGMQRQAQRDCRGEKHHHEKTENAERETETMLHGDSG